MATTPSALANGLGINLRPLLLLLGVAVAVAVGVTIVLWWRGPDWSLLYGNLSDGDAGNVVQALQTAGIEYKLNNSSGAIMVPAERVHDARLQLAAQGLPAGKSGGFAMIIKDPGFAGGTYSGPRAITNIAAFSVSMTLPELLDWTNRDTFSDIDRSQPLTIIWKNGVPGGWVQISGYSNFAVGDGGLLSWGFTCWADATTGSFTIPAAILSNIPPSIDDTGQTGGGLAIGQWIFPGGFTVSGIDLGRLVTVDSLSKLVRFR